MKNKVIWILAFACVLASGAFFRLWRLNDRPMHADEAVHAEKFKALQEEGFYAYDPDEFHGPTLNYSTLASTWLRGESTYSEISEKTLRVVPAIFGIGLILTPLFFRKGFSLRTILFSSILIAFSPAFIYYSRYYIQETLLLFFTASFLGCAWNYAQNRKLRWMIGSGVFVGLMHATKETFIFALIAAVLAWMVSALISRGRVRLKITHLLWAVAAMLLTSMMLFSSFGANPDGILDSVKTYGIWIQRAGGQSHHIYPWHYYLDKLVWLEFIEPFQWNEDGIVALAVIGGVIAFLKRGELFIPKSFAIHRFLNPVGVVRASRRGRALCKQRGPHYTLEKNGANDLGPNHLSLFLVLYAFVLTAIYSLIPYKTPWSMLSFLYGMALVAGMAANSLLEYGSGRWSKLVVGTALFIFGLGSPMIQSWALNFNCYSDPANPYVYAHTGKDVFKIVDHVQGAVRASGESVCVVSSGDDYWPLPWYFRNLPQVGYLKKIDESVCLAPIILAKAAHRQELLRVLYTVPESGKRHLYVPLFDETLYLRPGVEWCGFIRKEVWDQMQQGVESMDQKVPLSEGIMEPVPDRRAIPNLVKFSDEAMHACFEIFIQHEDGTYAGRAARAAFNEVARLEALLSRFVENSDVSRINQLPPLGSTVVDEDTIRCLLIAQRAYDLTDGAFNVAMRNGATPEMLRLDPDGGEVAVLKEGVMIDLGGIGKGYAVDAMARVLAEWGIERALIHGGASSILALDPPWGKAGWPIVIRNPMDESIVVRLDLANESMGCSGLQQGEHIINPFTGKPVADRRACWIRMKENSALVDALSTAGMIMPISAVAALQGEWPNLSVMLLVTDVVPAGQIIRWGNWPTE